MIIDNLKKSGWGGVLILALALRIVLAAFLYHTDVKAIYRDSRVIRSGIVAGYSQALTDQTPLVYPPAIYVLFDQYQQRAGFLFSDYFDSWMSDWGTLHTVNHPRLFADLLAMKLPMIVFDLLVAWLLVKLLTGKAGKLAGALWLLNPVSIYAIYGIGQFDIIPTALILLALLLWRRQKMDWAYVALGIGGGFKLFPLLLLPFLFAIDGRRVWKRLSGLMLAGLTFGMMLAPIWKSKLSLTSVFLSNLTGGLFAANFDLGGGEILSIFLVLYLLLFFALIFGWIRRPSLEAIVVIVYGLLFGLSHFHPQWMVWIMPFLVILLVEKRVDIKTGLLLLLAYLGVVFLIDDKFVGLGMFKAVNNAFDSLPSVRYWFDLISLGDKLQNLAHAGLLVAVLLVSWQLLGRLKGEGFLNSLPEIKKVAWSWLVGILVIFVLAHIPLAKLGFYIDTEQMSQQEILELDESVVVKQSLRVNNDGFNGVAVRLKNAYLNSRDELTFEILDEESNVLREVKVAGTLIGDDHDLNVGFAPIEESAGKNYILRIGSKRGDTGQRISVAFDGKTDEEGLTVNGVTRKGRLAYRTYFDPGSLADHLRFSLANIAAKL